MRKLVQTTLGVLASLLGLPAFGQLQVDWRQTYTAFGHVARTSESGTACAIAPNGDLVWSSHHNIATSVPYSSWQQHSEMHRTSPSGTTIWNLASPTLSNRHFERIHVDPAGDFYFSGFAGLNWGTFTEPLVVKVSANGTLLWSRIVSGTAYADDIGFGGLDPAGNFTFFGVHNDYVTPTHFVRTYDTNGNVILDTLAYSTPLGLDGISVAEPFPGGGFLVAGSSATGLFVARLAFDGSLLWRTVFPQGPSSAGRIYDLALDSSGRIAAAGCETDVAGLNWRTTMVLLDPSGNLLLDFAGTFPGASNAFQCHFAADDSLWLVAHESPLMNAPRYLVLRRWEQDLTQALELTYPLQLATTVLGESGQLWVLSDGSTLHEIAPTGAVNWSQLISAPSSFDRYSRFILAPDRHFVVLGRHDASAGAETDFDALVLRLDATDIPRGYCTGMQGTLGCAPLLQFEGTPRAGAASGFLVSATPWPSQTTGRFLAGVGPAVASPFFGGTLCVGAPRVRTPSLSSGGNPVGAPDCSGALVLDYSQWASGTFGGALLPGLQAAGTSVRLQAWSRDAGSAANTLLSNALEFTVLP